MTALHLAEPVARQRCLGASTTGMRRIEAILFDLGDTLLDFGLINTLELFARGARLAYSYLQQLGHPLPPFRTYHRRQLWAVEWNYFKSHFTRREFNSLDVLGRLSRRMGHRLTREQTEELAWLWYTPLKGHASVEPGAGDMLADFRRQGFRLGIVSNTFVPGEVLDRHLAEEGLLEFFPTRIYSCNVGFRKPETRIFRAALDALGARAEATIFVGDKLKADILGAQRAGMIAVLKDPCGTTRHKRIRPAYRIARLSALPAVVRACQAGDGPEASGGAAGALAGG